MKFGYKWSFFCFVLSVLAACLSAYQHRFGWTIFNFLVAMWNYFMFEYLLNEENHEQNDSTEDEE